MGRGPYSSVHTDKVIKHDRYDPKKRPGPWADDIKGFNSGRDFFGFPDIQQLKTWFIWKDRRAMKGKKFKAVVYEVEKKYVRYGNRQVVFNLSKAKKIKELCPLTLEEIDGQSR